MLKKVFKWRRCITVNQHALNSHICNSQIMIPQYTRFSTLLNVEDNPLAPVFEQGEVPEEEDDYEDIIIDDYEEMKMFPEKIDFITQRSKEITQHEPFLFAGLPIPHPPYEIKGPTLYDLKITAMLFGKIHEDPSMDFSLATVEELEKLDSKKGDDGLPMLEVAFCGRSNVGKSSLVNAVTGYEVSRVSNTPGHTKRLNFFNIGNKLYLVDLPGYGFAEGNLEEIEKWQQVMGHYLATRRNKLQRVFVLVDARRGLTRLDKLILEFLTKNTVAHQLVFTKCDLVKHDELCRLMKETYELVEKDKRYRLCYPFIVPCSSKDETGIEQVKAAIVSASGLTRTVRLMNEREKLHEKKKDQDLMKKELAIIAPDHPIFRSQGDIMEELRSQNPDINTNTPRNEPPTPKPVRGKKNTTQKKATIQKTATPQPFQAKKVTIHGLNEADEEQ